MRQPSNSWTNLAFTLVGSVVLLEAVAQDKFKSRSLKKMKEHRFGLTFATVFGVSNLILGFGSGWYHASLTFIGQFMDNVGMYLLVLSPGKIINVAFHLEIPSKALFALSVLRTNYTSTQFVLEFCAINTALGYLCYAFPWTRRHIFSAVIVVGVLSEAIARRKLGALRTQRTNLTILGENSIYNPTFNTVDFV